MLYLSHKDEPLNEEALGANVEGTAEALKNRGKIEAKSFLRKIAV